MSGRRFLPAVLCALLAATLLAPSSAESAEIRVGSKKFTESVILGEMLRRLAARAGHTAHHLRELGGTRILWNALRAGEIDIYPEYTGTLTQEILAGENIRGEKTLRARLAALGLRISRPLGFNNTYAIGMKREVAERLGIRIISDLRKHEALRFGFSNEFMDRNDGWPSLRQRYRLPQQNVRGLDHDLAYRALSSGTIEAMELYTTDAEIHHYKLRVLGDDLGHFPVYHAVILYRADLEKRAPGVVREILRLENKIAAAPMIRMNARVKIEKKGESEVAARFLARALGIAAEISSDSLGRRLLRRTGEHLFLVTLSLGAAILAALPLGIWAARRPRIGQIVLGAAGVIQTIPSLALLVFMIPLLGIGGPPAMVALFLYSLLPIVRNTHAGLRDIPPQVLESAEAIGLAPAARLRLVELPIAARSILAGIKTAAVINVGTATLGALIGAGGYGQPILTGIRLDDTALILEGAVPAALLALVVQGAFDLLERRAVSPGLRLSRAE
ncbi:MAG: ABC transporter permease subunit [bacterium]|nr:ABC transporter permease subunit [bacterium]